jgi:hypothetical protein
MKGRLKCELAREMGVSPGQCMFWCLWLSEGVCYKVAIRPERRNELKKNDREGSTLSKLSEMEE